MKFNFTLLIVSVFLLFTIDSHSQDISNTANGGEIKFNENKIPCLTDAQRKSTLLEIESNIELLKSQNRLAFDENVQRRDSHPLFIWPIKKKEGFEYNAVWAISNYVDQNAAYPNQVQDYNCGSKTYDTNDGNNHPGVDIYAWPFWWKMMDNDEAEIIAAAAGQIILIGRNQSDRNCSFNDNVWNAVYVQHADGSVALYGHMKKNSPTSKNVGDMVTQGEYLGIVGSSGSSTGPHLHFEVYSSMNPKVLVDPYKGPCNTLNSESWWLDQKPYVDPNINAALTHSAPPIFSSCPDQEITNEKNAFAAGETVYFASYLRDQIAGTILNLQILRPDGSTFDNWDYDLVTDNSSNYWYWSRTIPSIPGNWTWRVVYQEQVVDHNFTMGTLDIEDENFDTISIYPNPFNDVVNIKSKSSVKKITVIDILGKTIITKSNASESITEINLEMLSKGVYFMRLEGDENQKKIIKLIKD